jgi:Na+-driven multidrug efflux pump
MENKEDRRIYTLSQEVPAKAVIKMSIPLIFGMFIMVLYNLVDTYFIGTTGNDYQLAAVNLAYPVIAKGLYYEENRILKRKYREI